jgi:hypothetical protein
MGSRAAGGGGGSLRAGARPAEGWLRPTASAKPPRPQDPDECWRGDPVAGRRYRSSMRRLSRRSRGRLDEGDKDEFLPSNTRPETSSVVWHCRHRLDQSLAPGCNGCGVVLPDHAGEAPRRLNAPEDARPSTTMSSGSRSRAQRLAVPPSASSRRTACSTRAARNRRSTSPTRLSVSSRACRVLVFGGRTSAWRGHHRGGQRSRRPRT